MNNYKYINGYKPARSNLNRFFYVKCAPYGPKNTVYTNFTLANLNLHTYNII